MSREERLRSYIEYIGDGSPITHHEWSLISEGGIRVRRGIEHGFDMLDQVVCFDGTTGRRLKIRFEELK